MGSGVDPIIVTPAAKLEAAWHFYAENPVKYVEHVIFGQMGPKPRPDRIEPHQADALDFYAEHDRVAMRAANGVGKDVVTAWIIEHFLVTRYKARILVASPTGRQVRRTIFSEVAAWTKQSLAFPKLELLLTNELRHRDAPEDWWALGFSPAIHADDPTGGIEGIHSENLLFVITEAKAVDKAIWDAAKRMCTREGNKMFVQSVPGPSAGDFYDCFSGTNRLWKTMHFPSARWNEEIKRFVPTTWLVSAASIEEKRAEGEDSPNFVAGVLAEFLTQGANNLIALEHVQAAMAPKRLETLRREIELGVSELGVDCARYGDDSMVIASRKGPRILPLEVYSKQSEMEAAGLIVAAIRKYRPSTVRIDAIGVGAGTLDRLLEMQAEKKLDDKTKKEVPAHPDLVGVIIIGVNVSQKPTNETKWVNRRDEQWDSMAQRLKNGDAALPDDTMLREELVTVLFHYTSAGQKKIEPKDNHKKRIKRSPDRADAVCLAYGGLEQAIPMAMI